ncbi:hypothetical protein B0H13DRAFT_2312823 [Mycena leptocephala]|nr:hypothetical protein B0H13DRAFT_2312823 [Mycena leptocephala]
MVELVVTPCPLHASNSPPPFRQRINNTCPLLFPAEIKQHSNPFENLAERGKRRCQVNALKVMIPDLDPANGLPHGSEEVGGGYVLLRARGEYHQIIEGSYGDAILNYLEEEERTAAKDGWKPRVAGWARMPLQNGQIVCSVWKQSKPLSVRIARNIKVLAMAYWTHDPDILLALDASFEDATPDGEPRHRPDALAAVRKLAPTLPHLREVTIAFFKGSPPAWERLLGIIHK